MKVGMIARSEDRGLGVLSWEWSRNMRPDRTLIVHPHHNLFFHDTRYPEGSVVANLRDDGRFEHPEMIRAWLDGLDVVYAGETFYDWRICRWAREQCVRTVCHLMPEYFRQVLVGSPEAPDVWWAPTRWRLRHLPSTVRVVPVPVPLDRWPNARRMNDADPIVWMHTRGSLAAADRNGTRVFMAAVQYLQREHVVILRAQDATMPTPKVGKRTHIEMHSAATVNYWDMYGGVDALVLPRRYGGLTLPALEAMGAGCALLMPNIEPQKSEWPIVGFRAVAKATLNTWTGELPIYSADPRDLARLMDVLDQDRERVRDAQEQSRAWAEDHSWGKLAPVVRDELARACG